MDDLARVSHGLRFHAYQEAIRPFVKIRMDLFAVKMPKYIMHADGRMETEYEWTEEEKKMNAQIDELIHAEAVRVGLANQEEASHGR
jgi:DNA replication initiation complex subunit (GINS family)